MNSSVPSRTLLNVPDIGSRSEGTLELPKIFSSWRPLQRYSTEKAISPISVEKLYLHTLPAKLGIGNSKRCWTWSPAQVHVSGSFEFWSIPMKQASRDSKKWFSVIFYLTWLLSCRSDRARMELQRSIISFCCLYSHKIKSPKIPNIWKILDEEMLRCVCCL